MNKLNESNLGRGVIAQLMKGAPAVSDAAVSEAAAILGQQDTGLCEAALRDPDGIELVKAAGQGLQFRP